MAKDQVIVMGHKISDPDSFGACMGIYRAAVALEKEGTYRDQRREYLDQTSV